MTPAQMESFRAAMNVRPGHEWDKFEGLSIAPAELQAFLDQRAVRAGQPPSRKPRASRCRPSCR